MGILKKEACVLRKKSIYYDECCICAQNGGAKRLSYDKGLMRK